LDTAAAPIAGWCDPAFEGIRDAFANNFHEYGEVGASACVSVDGRVVADLWGGHRDAERSRPFEADTLVNVFSVGKGLVALLVARLVGNGTLDVDVPVARHWPRFASRGKEAVTVRDLLTHRAGLPAVRRRLPPGAMLDWEAMTAALADEEPWWPPGSAHGYHVNSFGFLVGEVVRRVAGSSVGALLRDEVALPLDADVHLGLPSTEHPRVAEFLWPAQPPPESEPAGLSDEQLMRHNAYFNPSGLSGAGVVNSPRWRLAEIPSTNTHATARGIARVYTALAAGGGHGGVRLVDPVALAEATTEQVVGHDLVLQRPTRFGLGFQLTQPERPLGPSAGAFGHFGAGGSLGFCDPEAGVAFGYAMNQLGTRWRNPRNRALIDAVYDALGAGTPATGDEAPRRSPS
jgi:CubicO group peptidase (beta-lactamase class C family)